MAFKTNYGLVKCVDCGKLFQKKSHQMVRCRECQAIRRKKQDKKYRGTKKESDLSYDPRISLCKRVKSCKYGTRTSGFDICDYIGMEGHSRGCPVEGCTKYKRRGKKKDE